MIFVEKKTRLDLPDECFVDYEPPDFDSRTVYVPNKVAKVGDVIYRLKSNGLIGIETASEFRRRFDFSYLPHMLQGIPV